MCTFSEQFVVLAGEIKKRQVSWASFKMLFTVSTEPTKEFLNGASQPCHYMTSHTHILHIWLFFNIHKTAKAEVNVDMRSLKGMRGICVIFYQILFIWLDQVPFPVHWCSDLREVTDSEKDGVIWEANGVNILRWRDKRKEWLEEKTQRASWIAGTVMNRDLILQLVVFSVTFCFFVLIFYFAFCLCTMFALGDQKCLLKCVTSIMCTYNVETKDYSNVQADIIINMEVIRSNKKMWIWKIN